MRFEKKSNIRICSRRNKKEERKQRKKKKKDIIRKESKRETGKDKLEFFFKNRKEIKRKKMMGERKVLYSKEIKSRKYKNNDK